MKNRSRESSMRHKPEMAIEEIGGEPLEGSGFEDETPDPEFSETTRDAEAPQR